MTHQIDTKHLSALLHPFQDNIHDIVAPEIQSLINFTIDEQKIRELLISREFDQVNEHLAQIARYSGSFPKAAIDVFIGNPNQGDTPYIKNMESLYLLSAAIYRQKKYIYVNVEGEENAVAQLLHINPTTPTIALDNFSTRKIDWNTQIKNENNAWANPKYVITQLADALKREYSKKDGPSFKNTLKMADKAVFEDAQFINDLVSMKNDVVDLLIREGLQTPLQILSMAYDKDFVVSRIWDNYARDKYEVACRNQFQLEDELRHDYGLQASQHIDYMYDNNKVSREDMNLLFEQQMRMIDEKVAQEAFEILEAATPFKNFFDTHIFNDTEKAVAFMKKYANPSFITYFSKEVRHSDLFASALIEVCDKTTFNSKLLHCLPISRFDVKSDFSHLETYGKLLKCMFFASSYQGYGNDDLTWFNSLPGFKDAQQMLILLKYFNENDDHVDTTYYNAMGVETVYENLHNDVKNNKEIVIQLIKIKHDFFYELPDNLKQDFDVMDAYIKCGGSPSSVSNEVLFSQTDKHIILNIIGRDYRVLNKTGCPLEWRTNTEYIEKCISHFEELKLQPHELEALFGDTDKGLKLLQTDVYKVLPVKYQECHEYALTILKMYRNNVSRAHIPEILWANDDFCIKAIQVNTEYTKKVPSFHWENRQFIIDILQGIDSLDINKNIFHHMPKQIGQFFLDKEISTNYSDFFKSFLLHHDLQEVLPQSIITRRQKKI